jgi:hypothetical protein
MQILERPFRFDADTHSYIDLATGAELPHITGMLELTGWINPDWYTEDASERGTAVHGLTADYDLGALELDRLVSRYRAYVLAYREVLELLQRPTMLAVEEPNVHPALLFGGRPDRLVHIFGLAGILEIKTGEKKKADQIQTALQAILSESRLEIPAEYQMRVAVYLRPDGRCKVEHHKERSDIRKAREVIAKCCH